MAEKCKRCKSTQLGEDTCPLCGEPRFYHRYDPSPALICRAEDPPRRRVGQPRGTYQKPVGGYRTDFLKEIEAFRARYSFPKTAFGRKFANDGNLINRLENGCIPRERTVTAIKAAMRAYEQPSK